LSRFLERWPLTIVGLILIGWAGATLAGEEAALSTRFVVLGLGVFLLGSGTTLVILGVGRGSSDDHDDKDDL
jgi:hypothetical protein